MTKLRPAIERADYKRPMFQYPRRDHWLLSRALYCFAAVLVLFAFAFGSVFL